VLVGIPNIFILTTDMLNRTIQDGAGLGIFDEIDKAMKKVEAEVKKANLDKNFKDIGDGLNNVGTHAPQQADPAATPARVPHPGYSRITAWVRTRYRGTIEGVTDPYRKNLELELIASEATSGLSAKAKKGFLDYLKRQNYEQLLK
jgi:hypothetical protein